MNPAKNSMACYKMASATTKSIKSHVIPISYISLQLNVIIASPPMSEDCTLRPLNSTMPIQQFSKDYLLYYTSH